MSNPRRANGHRRTQLRRRILATYTNCALCGRPVDKTLHHLDPWAPEVDEILPVSLGGDPLRWSNCRLVHRLCNQRRGNKIGWTPAVVPDPVSPMTSRDW